MKLGVLCFGWLSSLWVPRYRLLVRRITLGVPIAYSKSEFVDRAEEASKVINNRGLQVR